jgi:polysaccharide biosynthesis/export protein
MLSQLRHCLLAFGLLSTALLAGQATPQSSPRNPPGAPAPAQPSTDVHPSYLLGPGDVIAAWVVGADEFAGKQFVVSPSGFIDFPMAGRVLAAGKTVEQLKADLIEKLKFYFNDPAVSLSIVDFHSQPVSILGSVKQPGVHQLQGGKSLLEAMSLAGGVTSEASSWAIITRRAEWGPIPVPGATKDASGKYYIARISLSDVADAKTPQYDIQICPHDVIEVPRARLIYVIGQVSKPGGFVLNDNENISALQALSMAGGSTQYASLKNAKVLRTVPGAHDREHIAVNLHEVIGGNSADVILKPDDILYVPSNLAKNVSLRAIEESINVGTGLLIWH